MQRTNFLIFISILSLFLKEINSLVPSDIESCLAALRNGGLIASNNYRSKHSAPPLIIDNTINEVSLKYANVLISTFGFDHNPNLEKLALGENLFRFMSTDTIDLSPKNCEEYGKEAVTDWYNEISSYDFKTGQSKDGNEVGHFTQLVWKETTNVGFGFATAFNTNDQMYYFIVVSNYSPVGNVVGLFNQNVLPLQSA